MAITGRYSTIDKAIIVTTGNTLVLCGDTSASVVNTGDMMTSDGKTTRDYSLAGSSANLKILDGSKILYAELVWLSTVKSTAQGAVDVRSIQDNPITFVTPKETLTLTPSYTDNYTSSAGTVDRLRAVDITNLIKNSLSGTYTVRNVPTSIPPTGLSEVRAGWALTVIYRNNSFKPKRIVYAVGLEAATSSTPLQASFAGFTTDSNEEFLNGDLITVFANGNIIDGNDTFKIGPSFAKLTIIGNSVGVPSVNPGTAPNNPWNSYNSGQINIADTLNSNKGLIDISGTKGTLNHDAFVPTQVIGARNKWDITCVDISNTLIPNQTQLTGQYTTPAGEVELIALASEVNSEAPDIVATLDSYDIDGDSEYNLNLGESLIYVVKINNSGKTNANDVILSTTLNPALEFIPNSLTINGISKQGADITKGVNIGAVEPTGIANVSFTVRAVSLVEGGKTADTTVNYNYSFNSGAGSPTYINYGETNTLSLIIQDGSLSIVKKVSAKTVSLGDTIVYTTEVTNTGSETAFNILFQDKINEYCSFVDNSVQINGISFEDYNPNEGFSIPNINPGNKTTITFSVKVNNLTPNTVLENGALVTFSYIFNQYVVPIVKTILSNPTSIQIQFSEIIAKRTADNYYPNANDKVTYTLSLTNIGNISATNVQVIEPPVTGATFVDGSVYINGTQKPGYNPFTGFTLDSIDAQTTTTVTYQILINELSPNQIIENIAKIPFKYQISSEEPIVSSEKDSNKVTTITNYVVMKILESVDKAYASIGNTLYYSINITNNGNIDALNTTFLSVIQKESEFIPNTVAINGLIQKGLDPNLGFSLGTISPENTINVTFQVKVNGIPTQNIINNNSALTYSYKPDPNGSSLTNTITSNTVQTTINKISYNFAKFVDKTYAVVDEYLVYKCTIANTGTVNLLDVYFSDEISAYVKFVPESVYVDGIKYPKHDPYQGFNIGTIKPNQSVEILFGVQIKTAPPFGYVVNLGDMIYSYKLNPNSPVVKESSKSNAVQTKVTNGNLSLTKYENLSYAAIGDTINYSLDISNTGNVTVNNIFFFDKIPNGLTFVSGSVLVNGISKPDFNPIDGFNIGSLNASQVATISFNAKVTNIPSPNVVTNNGSATYSFITNPDMPPVSKTSTSNNVTTTLNKASSKLTKVVDNSYAAINDVVTYTITTDNTGTVTLTNAYFKDLVAAGATFITDSVVIDGVKHPSYDPNIGFSISDILPSGSVVISFNARITSVPTPPQIDNYGTMSCKYKLNPSGKEFSYSTTSNTVTTYISQATVTNIKSVDKSYAQVNDVITYTSVIKNTGNTNITDTNFVDSLENNLIFKANSVIINNTPYSNYDPTIGFTLGTIEPNNTVTVVFKATISSLPDRGYVENKSILYYSYKVNPSDPSISSNAQSNTATTYVKSGTLSIAKTSNRDYARLTDVIEYSFTVKNTGNTLLSNLFFQDTIQAESSFNAGSVYVNNVKKDTYNPNTGFALDNLDIGEYASITFSVTVNSLPSDGKLYNTGNVSYSYYVDPASQPINTKVTSNQTIVNINDAIVSATKSVDKASAKLQDTLKFSVSIYNGGNVSAQNVNFKDLLQSNLTFNKGSVTVNGTSKPDFNPNDGFVLDDITSLSTTTVAFEATIASRPANNIIENFATINYQYRINPSDPFINVTINTNTTSTYVAVGELTLTKSANTLYATVNDVLTYTINVTNTGSVKASNLSFTDLNQNNCTFVPKSVVIDGFNKETLDPNVGFSLQDLLPNEYIVISFNVKVNSLPDSGIVTNIANTKFNYQLTPSDPVETATATSNTETTNINLGKLTILKAVNEDYATLNDTLTYTFTIKNIGNVTCTDTLFTDVIQSNGTFVDGSIKINDVSKPTYNPNKGFNLGNVTKGSTITVTFNVLVNSLPADYYLKNTATIKYEYVVDPNKKASDEGTTTSNLVTTTINLGKLNVTKEINKAYATIDDIVSYTVTIVNAGNTNAENVNFRDVIPLGLAFIKDSVKVNGVSKPGFDPYQSFTLGTIELGDSVAVKFDTTVTSIPSPSLITNKANIVFSYKINPNKDYITTEIDSNPVTTQINLGKLTLNKTVNKGYSKLNDELIYTIEISNTGTVDAANVIFTDGIQLDTTFISGSVTVNGESKTDYNPINGFNLGTIATLGKTTVSFKVTVSSIPAEYTILNFATGTFSYKINPSGETFTKSTVSNSVSTLVVSAGLSANKSVNLDYATIDDILEYSITVKNTGDTTNSKLFFSDTLSNGAAFEKGSVMIDNVSKPDFNPLDGFALADLSSGNITVIGFKAKVTSVPTPPQVTNFASVTGVYKVNPTGPDYNVSTVSNTVTTQINAYNISISKTVDKVYAKVSDTLTYASVIKNTGNIIAQNTLFSDPLQSDIEFIKGTVIINNVAYPSLDPIKGFTLGDIEPAKTVTVSFDVKIDKLPVPPQVVNKSQMDFSYRLSPTGNLITTTAFSNSVVTNVVQGQISASKTVDKSIATVHDMLVYSINLTNAGNVSASNIFFQDTPSTGAVFKAGSVIINNVSKPDYDPTKGFSLDDIGIGNVTTIIFTAEVISIPETNKVINQATINFKYVVDPKDPPFTDTITSNTTTTNIAVGNLNVTKSVNKKYATIGEYLTYTIVINNIGNIKTTNVVFLDATPKNSIYVTGSVTVNGESKPNYNPAVGFDLNDLNPGEIVTVIYKVQVVK